MIVTEAPVGPGSSGPAEMPSCNSSGTSCGRSDTGAAACIAPTVLSARSWRARSASTLSPSNAAATLSSKMAVLISEKPKPMPTSDGLVLVGHAHQLKRLLGLTHIDD